jgi:hypothetical protein
MPQYVAFNSSHEQTSNGAGNHSCGIDISFSVRHIAGINNVLADALSKGKRVNTGMVNKHVSEMVKEINLADVFDTF